MGFFDKALKKVQDVGENIAASASNVKTVVDVDRPCELSAEDCAALVEVLKCRNEMANLELKEVYFKGCIDCVSYLKKLNIL